MSPPSFHLFLNNHSSSLIIHRFRQLIWVHWPWVSLDHTVPTDLRVSIDPGSVHQLKNAWWTQTPVCFTHPPPCIFLPFNLLASLVLTSEKKKTFRGSTINVGKVKESDMSQTFSPKVVQIQARSISSSWKLRKKCSQRCLSFKQYASEILTWSIYSRKHVHWGFLANNTDQWHILGARLPREVTVRAGCSAWCKRIKK